MPSRRNAGIIALLMASFVLAPLALAAPPEQVLQGESKLDTGVRVPGGETQPGGGKTMLVHDEWMDETVVGTAVLIGESGSVLEMPSGRLQFAKTADLQETARQFVPDDKMELGRLFVNRFFPRFKVKTSKYYLYVYNSTDNFQQGTQAILESMLPGVIAYFKKLGFEVHEPRVPLVVLMFRTEAEYRKLFNPTTGWSAFYNHNVNFIAMFEQASKPDELRTNAQQRAITTIAHEGAHQLLSNIGVQQRLTRWPLWTTEGIADFFAPTNFGARLTWAGPGKVHEGRLLDLVKQLAERQGQPIDGSLLKMLVTAVKLESKGYSAAWGLTYFLAAKKPKEFLAYMRDMSRIEPNQGVPRDAVAPVAENLALFQKHFGDDLAAIERDWFQYIHALYQKHEAERIYYVTLMHIVAGRQIQRRTGISHSAAAAKEWQAEQIAALPPAVRRTTRVETKPVQGRAVAEGLVAAWLKQ